MDEENETLLTPELYDSILDALDSENIEILNELFLNLDLSPDSDLFDAPRFGQNDELLITYMDYIIAHNLRNVLEYFIDEVGYEITDTVMKRCLELDNQSMYEFIVELGYIPQSETLKYSVKNCLSDTIANILELDSELIDEITEEDIEYLFSFDIDETTVETIHVLFNHGINPNLFSKFLKTLKEPNNENFSISENEQDFVIEIIEVLESNNVL